MGCLLFAERFDESPYAVRGKATRFLACSANHSRERVQNLLSDRAWSVAASSFSRECCALMGASAESPFAVAVDAGAAALPTLLKMTAVMTAKGQPWEGLEQLPLEVELPPRFAFHSVFACPVARDQSTPDNPPMILPCGYAALLLRSVAILPCAAAHAHPTCSLVLCKQSIHKLARGNARVFKCPYCPVRACAACMQQHADVLVLCPDRGCRQPMQGDQVLGLIWDASDLRETLPPPDFLPKHALNVVVFARSPS